MWPRNSEFPKKSILTPIGALACIIFATCVTGAVITAGTILSWVLIAIGALPLLIALWAYIYFAVREPDRLQTEDYRIQKEVIARLPPGIRFSESQIPPPDARLVDASSQDEDK